MRRNGHKYNAQPTMVDNIRFASKAEAKRYGELKMLEKAGKISDLCLQPRFPLLLANRLGIGTVSLGVYVADFQYVEYTHPSAPGVLITEDVKGVKTPLYRWKKKHVEAQYGITITEITR